MGRKIFRQRSRRLPSHITVIFQSSRFLATLLCRHQNDTVGGTRTVDSRRCGIFQYRQTLNVVRIDVINRRNDQTVHDIHRVCIIQRTDTTDADRRIILTRLPAVLHDGYTRQHPLQCSRGIGYRPVSQRFRINGRYRACHIHLFLDSVPDNDNLFQVLSIFF